MPIWSSKKAQPCADPWMLVVVVVRVDMTEECWWWISVVERVVVESGVKPVLATGKRRLDTAVCSINQSQLEKEFFGLFRTLLF